MEAEQIARAKANELPISPKHAIEITRFIKGKTTKEAIAYLEDVVALKKAIPFKRFNRNVAHKRGLDKWDAGRYPVKASSEFLKVLRSVEKMRNTSVLILRNLRSSSQHPTEEEDSAESSRVQWEGLQRNSQSPQMSKLWSERWSNWQ